MPTWQGERSSAALEAAVHPNGTAVPGAHAPGGRGAAGLYGLFWQLRGGECSVKTGFGVADAAGGSGGGASDSNCGALRHGALHASSGNGLPVGTGEPARAGSAAVGSAGVPAAGWEGQSVGCSLALHGNASQVPVWRFVQRQAQQIPSLVISRLRSPSACVASLSTQSDEEKLVQADCVGHERYIPRNPLLRLPPCAMQGEQWWRLRCQVLDSAEQPLNASATQSAACPPGQLGPRQATPSESSCLPL